MTQVGTESASSGKTRASLISRARDRHPADLLGLELAGTPDLPEHRTSLHGAEPESRPLDGGCGRLETAQRNRYEHEGKDAAANRDVPAGLFLGGTFDVHDAYTSKRRARFHCHLTSTKTGRYVQHRARVDHCPRAEVGSCVPESNGPGLAPCPRPATIFRRAEF